MFSLISWTTPEWLFALPLALLPWITHNAYKTIPWGQFVPVDPLSNLILLFLKTLGSLAIASLLIVLAHPYQPEKTVERFGEGAEFIILLDRSRSMDDIFNRRPRNTMPVDLTPQRSKRSVSADYLSEFVKRRPDDRFGYVFFSIQSTEILSLTYNKAAILATISAGSLGRGISQTNIVEALSLAAEMYQREDYRGSRNVLLISDGGQILTSDEERYLTQLYRKMNLNIYWIYLRSIRGMTLDESDEDSIFWTDLPERKLHDFFKRLEVPYTAFEAGSMEEYAAAIDEIDRQQYQPLIVEEVVPKQSNVDGFLALSCFALLLLASAYGYSFLGVRQTRQPRAK